MILLIIFVVIAIVAGVLTAATREKAKNDQDIHDARVALRIVRALTITAAVLTLFFTSFNPVGTRQEGIVTSYGRVVGHLGPGPNLTWPWEQVTSMDEAVQLTDETFTVRITGGQTAQATVQIRWRVPAEASNDVFQNYKNATSGVENGLLTPELNVAANTVLDGYDPITPLVENLKPGTPNNPTTAQLATSIQNVLTPRLNGDVQVITLVLKPLVYDKTVQNNINRVTEQEALTAIAQQSVQTATQQAAANKIAQKALASDPLVLVQQCLTALANGKFTPPAGFSCWPGANSGIVIPSK